MIFRDKRKTPEYTAVCSSLAVGVIVHLFALVTSLHNFDDIANQPGGYGAALELGRWMLELLGRFTLRIGLSYNLPVVNGLVGIALLSITAGVLVSVLRIQNRGFAALTGGLFVAFPTVAATMLYRFTVSYYALAVLLAVLSVWVLRKGRLGLVWSALFLALSMGIYQAYAPLAIGLHVLVLLQQSILEQPGWKKLAARGVYDCLALILGAALYFLAMELSLRLAGLELTSYQGLDAMGLPAVSSLPKLIVSAYEDFFSLVYRDYCGLSGRRLVQLIYLSLMALSVALTGYLLAKMGKKPANLAAVVLLLALFPLAVNFIVLMCPDGWIYTLMVYSFVLVGCLPMVLAECLPAETAGERRAKNILTAAAGIGVACLVFCCGYFDNVNYSALYYANRQAENYVSSIVVQARMTKGFTPDKQWALLGEIHDPLLQSPWAEEGDYGGNSFAQHLLTNYSRNKWFEIYVGYTLPLADEQTLAQLSQSEEVRQMPLWPSEGSVKVVGDTVVIKFGEFYA